MYVTNTRFATQNHMFSGTGKIAGVVLPDFTDVQVNTKKESGVSDDVKLKCLRFIMRRGEPRQKQARREMGEWQIIKETRIISLIGWYRYKINNAMVSPKRSVT
jgi:hypothetical protein